MKVTGGVLERSWLQAWAYKSFSLKVDAVLCTVTFK
jgi:hypothetical protein